nr:leucine-rich repeat extensin-like protein 3 [Ipomoea batatas]
MSKDEETEDSRAQKNVDNLFDSIFATLETKAELEIAAENESNVPVILHRVLSEGYDDSSWPLQTKTGSIGNEDMIVKGMGVVRRSFFLSVVVSRFWSAYNWDDFDACCEQVDTSRVQRQGNWDDFDAYCEEVETSRVQRQESRTTVIFDL